MIFKCYSIRLSASLSAIPFDIHKPIFSILAGGIGGIITQRLLEFLLRIDNSSYRL